MNKHKENVSKNKITLWYEKKNVNILWKCSFKAVGGILLALLIAFFTSSISQLANNGTKIKTENNIVNSLIIGTNRDYVDYTLGEPFLFNTNEKTNLDDCFYRVNGAIIRIFYEDNCAKGIFITLTENKSIGKFAFDKYIELTDNKKLGEFTYDNLDDNFFESNYSQHTNGIDILFYFEQYYYNSWGGYHSHYYGIMPYGIFINPKEDSKNNQKHWYFTQWGNEFPNTIGIIKGDYENKICAMILDIDRIDYLSISLWLEQEENYYKYNNDDITFEESDIDEGFVNYFNDDLEAYLKNEYYYDYYNSIQ